MKMIRSWEDLKEHGFDPLTREACGLSYRLLCDVSPKGKAVLEKALGIAHATLFDPWNRNRDGDPFIRVGSVLLPEALFEPLAVFALLESGHKEVYVTKDGTVHAVEDSDKKEEELRILQVIHGGIARRFAYEGTAGDRNTHQMSGRVV